MADEIITTGAEGAEEDTTKKYLEQIENLKKNSISKEKYDKLMQENKSLLESIVNGTGGGTETAEETVDLDKIRKDLFGGKELSNLDYCKNALQLRDEILKSEGKDIFVGQGHQLTPTQEAYDSAQRVADVMRECIENCGGDSDLFTAQLMSRTNDVVIPKRKKK